MQPQHSLFSLLRTVRDELPEKEFLRIAGESFTYGEACARVETVARGLRELGLKPGERVGVMAGNLPESVWIWVGANAAGIIDVPFNAETRGALLEYFVADTEPRVLAGTEEYLTRLAETCTNDPDIVIAIGDCERPPFGDRARHLSFADLVALGEASTIELDEPAPGHSATIMYTSGTTGPSKGVLLPQGYYPAQGSCGGVISQLQPEELVYCSQPLYHIDARVWLSAAAHCRATVALGGRFSVSRFWDEVRQHNAAVFGYIGTMMLLLAKRPEHPDDATQPARFCHGAAMPAELHREFERRFGLTVSESWGMTECAYGARPRGGVSTPGRVGYESEWLSLIVVDDDDNELPDGVTGEICFRPKIPFVMFKGYWRKDEETAASFRNLWFHTGDLARRHADGQFEFVGRKKDSIRRRGENISAWEVEQAACRHPDVLEAAAIGVPSEVGEEDVAIFCVLVPGRALQPELLIEFMERDLQRFAVPRYLEFVDALPKTPSERIKKGDLKERGVSDDAWDANVALGRR